MKVLVYPGRNQKTAKKILSVIEARVPKEKTEIYRTIDGLSQRLRQPKYNLTAAILLAGARKELLDLLFIRDLFHDVRIILLLPGREKETFSLGCKLYPRFISYADGNFTDVGAVLGKMLEYINEKQKIYTKEVKKYGKISRNNGSGDKGHGRKGR